jgi:hypothetical protein
MGEPNQLGKDYKLFNSSVRVSVCKSRVVSCLLSRSLGFVLARFLV